MGKGGAVGLWGLMDDSLKVRLAGARGVARIPSLRDGPQGSVYIRLLPGHVTRVVGPSSRAVAGLFQCVSEALLPAFKAVRKLISRRAMAW